MKKYLAALLLLFISVFSYAQQYQRSAITPIYLVHSSGKLDYVNFADSVTMPEKYDYNFFGNNKMSVAFDMLSPANERYNDLTNRIENLKKSGSASAEQLNSLYEQLKVAMEEVHIEDSMRVPNIIKAINENKIPNKILKSILVDPNLGYMTMDVLSKRNLYNASDADYIKAMNSEYKLDAIKGNFEPLLRSTYILVIDNQSYTTESTIKEDSRCKQHILHANAFLFQIDLDSIMKNGQFNELLFMEQNATKSAAFDVFNFPIKLVKNQAATALVDNYEIDSKGTGKALLKSALNGQSDNKEVVKYIIRDPQAVQLDIANEIVEDALENISKNYEPFKLKTAVFATHPIRAKIGKKESLKVDQLFKVTENVQGKDGTITERKIGWLRSKKVVDNRINSTGNTEPSTFYKVYSKKVEKGMKLKQVNESGTILGLGYNLGDNIMGGPIVTIDQVTHISPGLRLGLGVGGFSKMNSATVSFDNIEDNSWKFTGTNIYFDLTIQKIIQANKVEFTPFVGGYYSMLMIDKFSINGTEYNISDYESLKGLTNDSYGALAGFKFGINLGKNTQINMGYKLGFQIGSNLKADNADEVTSDSGDKITMTFNKPSAFSFGIRLFGF